MTSLLIVHRSDSVSTVARDDAVDALPARLQAPLRDMLGPAPVQSVTPVPGGSQVQVWKVQVATLFTERYALRLVRRPLDLLDRQAQALRDLAPVPSIAATIIANRALRTGDSSSPECAQLTTWLDGAHPTPRRLDDAAAVGLALAHLHRGLQGKETSFTDRPLILHGYDRYVARLTELLDEDRPVIAGLSLNRHRVRLWEHLQNSARFPAQLLHGDLHAANIVIGPDRSAAFIDFDKMMVGPRIFDLAKYIATSLYYGHPRARLARTSVNAFLDSYTSITPLTGDERLCLDALVLLLVAETALVGTSYDLPHLVDQADAIGNWWATSQRRRSLQHPPQTPPQTGHPSQQLELFTPPTRSRSKQAPAPPLLVAVSYHRIGHTDPDNPYHRLHAIDPDTFAAQIDLLSERGTFVSLEQLREPASLAPLNILITFDDAPQDALTGITHLEQHDIPYTVAICTGLADNGFGIRDKVYLIAQHLTDNEIYRTLRPDFKRLLPPEHHFSFYWFSKSAALPHRVMEEQVIDPLFARVSAHRELPPGPAYLGWDDIRRLAASPLAAIVNHGHSHANLAGLSQDGIANDVDRSTRRLRAELPAFSPGYYATPYGHADQRTCLDLLEALHTHGYEGALWIGKASNVIEPRHAPAMRHISRLHAPATIDGLREAIEQSLRPSHQQRYLAQAITPTAHREPVAFTDGNDLSQIRAFERLVREDKPYAITSKYFNYQFTNNPNRASRTAYHAATHDNRIEAAIYNFHTTFQLRGQPVPGVYIAGWRKLPRSHHLASGALLRHIIQREPIVGVHNPNAKVAHAFTAWNTAAVHRCYLTPAPLSRAERAGVEQHDHYQSDLDALCHHSTRRYPFSVNRTAKFYRWRYDNYPLADCFYVVAREDGEPTGFAVIVRAGSTWSISDYVCLPQPGTFLRLVNHVRDLAFDADAETIVAQTTNSDDAATLQLLPGSRAETIHNSYHFNHDRLEALGINPDIDWHEWELHETEASSDILLRPTNQASPDHRTHRPEATASGQEQDRAR